MIKGTSLVSLGLVGLVVSFCACTLNPTVGDVVDRSTPVICQKAKECLGDATFAQTYPGGVDDCTAKTKDAVKAKTSDTSATSVCDDDEVNKCLDDLRAEACPAGGALPAIPCNC